MYWIVADLILAGALVGFATGASPTPTGGSIAAAVVAFLVGAVSALERSGALELAGITSLAQLCFIFLTTLATVYVATNVLRRKGKLAALGFRGPKHLC